MKPPLLERIYAYILSIGIDEWPWLAPYIEIEVSSEKEVRAVAKQLGFSWSSAVFGDPVPGITIDRNT